MILKELRGELTQQEVAIRLKITTSHYGFIENGTRTPSLKLAKKISSYYGKSIEDIFFGNQNNK